MSNLNFVGGELLAGDPFDSGSGLDELPHQDAPGSEGVPGSGMNSLGRDNLEIPEVIMATTQIQVTETELVFLPIAARACAWSDKPY